MRMRCFNCLWLLLVSLIVLTCGCSQGVGDSDEAQKIVLRVRVWDAPPSGGTFRVLQKIRDDYGWRATVSGFSRTRKSGESHQRCQAPQRVTGPFPPVAMKKGGVPMDTAFYACLVISRNNCPQSSHRWSNCNRLRRDFRNRQRNRTGSCRWSLCRWFWPIPR